MANEHFYPPIEPFETGVLSVGEPHELYWEQSGNPNGEPVLFLHGRFDTTCETLTSTLADPMRAACANLLEHIVDSGHWMAQEQPAAVNAHLAHFLSAS